MNKIAIIGGGIVGASAAFYLSKAEDFDITVFDEKTGQATSQLPELLHLGYLNVVTSNGIS